MYCRNHTFDENLTINVIFGIVYFQEIILESSQNVSETTPWSGIEGQIKVYYTYMDRDQTQRGPANHAGEVYFV